jgi:L-iditol 2-dehydrogenase
MMKQTNMVEFGKYVVEDADIPVPEPGQVRIAVKVCGICGSDVHAFLGEHPFINPPIVVGHEFSGVIDALGEGVNDFAVGDRVTVEPSLVCGECEMCLGGKYNICESLRVLGCQATGGMADYITVPVEKVISIPDEMDFEDGAMVEPAAVGVHAVRRADLSRVQRALVIGAGPIGLLTFQAAKALGIPTVIVTDVVDFKLEKARQLGATHAINVKRESLSDFLTAQYGKPNSIDLVLECVGSEATLYQAIEAVKKGGQIVIVGVPTELELLGTIMYRRPDFEEARDFMVAGKIQTKPLVTARFPMQQVDEAINDLVTKPAENIKTLISILP